MGLVLTDHKYTYTRGVNEYAYIDLQSEIDKLFNEMEREAVENIDAIGLSRDNILFNKYLEMKYRQQGKTFFIRYNGSLQDSVKAFEDIYSTRYGYLMDETPYIETCILEVIVKNYKPDLYMGPKVEHIPKQFTTIRAYYGKDGWLETAIFRRNGLKPGAYIEGPAVIWSIDSTTLIRPGYFAEVDEYGNLLIKRR